MFDSLGHAELVAALGATMRAAARGAVEETGSDEFARTQLLSGSSIARYLAAELRHGPALAAWFVATVTAELVDPPAGTDPDSAAACAHAADRIRDEPRPEHTGEVLADLLTTLAAARRPAAPGPAELLLRRRLRELADHQVTLLTGDDPFADRSESPTNGAQR